MITERGLHRQITMAKVIVHSFLQTRMEKFTVMLVTDFSRRDMDCGIRAFFVWEQGNVIILSV